jgi:hypothetical protein
VLSFYLSIDLADDVSSSMQIQYSSFVLSIPPNSCDDAASYVQAMLSITSSISHASWIANEQLPKGSHYSSPQTIFSPPASLSTVII